MKNNLHGRAKRFGTCILVCAALIFLAVATAEEEENPEPVKKSSSWICHCPGGQFYQRTCRGSRAFNSNGSLRPGQPLPVSIKTNISKGALGPLNWMPPNERFACEYVLHFAQIIDRHGLELPASKASSLEVRLTGNAAPRSPTSGMNVRLRTSTTATFRFNQGQV